MAVPDVWFLSRLSKPLTSCNELNRAWLRSGSNIGSWHSLFIVLANDKLLSSLESESGFVIEPFTGSPASCIDFLDQSPVIPSLLNHLCWLYLWAFLGLCVSEIHIVLDANARKKGCDNA
jgi:hypothetical protein